MKTLHAPGAAVLSTNYRTPAYWATVSPATAKNVGVILLEPTKAQLARGIRVLWISQTSCAPAAALWKLAEPLGWLGGLSRSRYLSEPPTGGAEDRRGRRLERETVAVRLRHEARLMAAWAVWEFDVERATWSADTAQIGYLMPAAGLAGVRSVQFPELSAIVRGVAWKPPKRKRKGEAK